MACALGRMELHFPALTMEWSVGPQVPVESTVRSNRKRTVQQGSNGPSERVQLSTKSSSRLHPTPNPATTPQSHHHYPTSGRCKPLPGDTPDYPIDLENERANFPPTLPTPSRLTLLERQHTRTLPPTALALLYATPLALLLLILTYHHAFNIGFETGIRMSEKDSNFSIYDICGFLFRLLQPEMKRVVRRHVGAWMGRLRG